MVVVRNIGLRSSYRNRHPSILKSVPRSSPSPHPLTSQVPFEICPIPESLECFGRKWALLVLRDVAFLGDPTFGQILRRNPGPTPPRVAPPASQSSPRRSDHPGRGPTGPKTRSLPPHPPREGCRADPGSVAAVRTALPRRPGVHRRQAVLAREDRPEETGFPLGLSASACPRRREAPVSSK